MTMSVGHRYCCQNPDCRCEIEVIMPSTEAGLNPKCCCGEEMKKHCTKPTFKILNFKAEIPDDFVRMKDQLSILFVRPI